MKKNKYIAGDWVKFKKNYYQILDASNTKVSIPWCKANAPSRLFVRAVDVTPIPLTSEILEKNGWEASTGGLNFTFEITNSSHLSIEWRDEKIFKVFYYQRGKYIRLVDILYVHQLQHLLWALGMDDDLKI